MATDKSKSATVSTETKHTPEPWVLCGDSNSEGIAFGIQASDGSNVAGLASYNNARRIVACVNACAGMSTDTLELAANGAPDVKEWFEGWGNQHNIELQRDELADALSEILASNPHSQAAVIARAALAKVSA